MWRRACVQGKGSNVSKTNRAREDAAKRKAGEGKGGGGAEGKAVRTGTAAGQSIICATCRVRPACRRRVPRGTLLQFQHVCGAVRVSFVDFALARVWGSLHGRVSAVRVAP